MLSTLARFVHTETVPRLWAPHFNACDFHFCRIFPGDKPELSIQRQTHRLCEILRLNRGQKVLHIESGTGETAVELARFAEVTVVGLEANAHKIRLAVDRASQAGLSQAVSFVQGKSIAQLAARLFGRESFDAIIVIEALRIAPTFASAYAEWRPWLYLAGSARFGRHFRALIGGRSLIALASPKAMDAVYRNREKKLEVQRAFRRNALGDIQYLDFGRMLTDVFFPLVVNANVHADLHATVPR
ncbi:uncharacterized protein BXZ73DRAFT_106424 [Epithele typhae]|uniref:uncharacterized protein n=1 Tax=Epithele typhae TaxID=378194 RepID=UPI0020078C26|nr:uncharacterized protein BXZ73DRAFT_106424 [Epithele typhae]KAH9914915.1 hypothetical protein BXZ73DRAFT_106424 [Epithele typhae]